jgi:site-specific recombinase XerD
LPVARPERPLPLDPRKLTQSRRDSSVVSRHSYYSRAKIQKTIAGFEAYLDHQTLSPATVRNYLADLRAFAHWHSAHAERPATFSAKDFLKYRDYLLRHTAHSPATVNRRLQALRLLGRFLMASGYAKENPVNGIRLVENGHPHLDTPHTLSHSEIHRLNAAVRAEHSRWTRRDDAIVQLMLHAGLQVHEIAELELGDLISLERGMSIQVRSQRPNRARVIPLNAQAAQALRDYLSTRPAIPRHAHLFLSQRGQPLSMRSIQRLIDDYARAAGLEKVCPQTLRNTFAKNMVAETRDVHLVARWLGCRSTKSLDRYTT